jgi:hypothetical protein
MRKHAAIETFVINQITSCSYIFEGTDDANLNFDDDQQRVDRRSFHLLKSWNPDFKENHPAEDKNFER